VAARECSWRAERAAGGRVAVRKYRYVSPLELDGALKAHARDRRDQRSRTPALNLLTLDWDEKLLAAFDIPERCCQSAFEQRVYGEAETKVRSRAFRSLDPRDQQAAWLAQACFRPGEVKNTYGTGCFLLMNTGERPVPIQLRLAHTVAYKFGGGAEPPRWKGACHYRRPGAVAARHLGIIEKSTDVEMLARTVDDNGGVTSFRRFPGCTRHIGRRMREGSLPG